MCTPPSGLWILTTHFNAGIHNLHACMDVIWNASRDSFLIQNVAFVASVIQLQWIKSDTIADWLLSWKWYLQKRLKSWYDSDNSTNSPMMKWGPEVSSGKVKWNVYAALTSENRDIDCFWAHARNYSIALPQGKAVQRWCNAKNQKNIHIKSTECPFLRVFDGMCFLRYMASKSLKQIGQNRVLVWLN